MLLFTLQLSHMHCFKFYDFFYYTDKNNRKIWRKIQKNFDKSILILRKLGKIFCLFLMIFSRFLSVYVLLSVTIQLGLEIPCAGKRSGEGQIKSGGLLSRHVFDS